MKIRRSHPNSGHETEHDTAHERDDDRKGERRAVDGRLIEPRDTVRTRACERAKHERGDCEKLCLDLSEAAPCRCFVDREKLFAQRADRPRDRVRG